MSPYRRTARRLNCSDKFATECRLRSSRMLVVFVNERAETKITLFVIKLI